jgi:hypothetical protein
MSGRKTVVTSTPSASDRKGFRWRVAACCLIAVVAAFAAFGDIRAPVPRTTPASRRSARAQTEAPRARSEPELFRPAPLPIPPAPPAAPVPAPDAVPLEAPRRTWPSAAFEVPTRVDPPAVKIVPTLPAPSAAPSKPHRVPFTLLAAWSKPGLCSSTSDAAAVRDRMTADFREILPDDGGRLYLDPRLPADAEQPIVENLRRTEAEVAKRLALRPARPLTFVYADQPLMKAAACINENVVAFYDGALHIVANRSDVLQSLLHEYTHHALFYELPELDQSGFLRSCLEAGAR